MLFIVVVKKIEISIVESEKHKHFCFSQSHRGFMTDIGIIWQESQIFAIPDQKYLNFHKSHFLEKKKTTQKPAANNTVHNSRLVCNASVHKQENKENRDLTGNCSWSTLGGGSLWEMWFYHSGFLEVRQDSC